MRMVNRTVHVLAEKIFGFLIAQQSKRCRIAECAIPVSIDSIDRFRHGIQQEANSFLAFVQFFLGALAVRYFLLQFDGAFVNAPLQVFAGDLQLAVPCLNLSQHFVEAVDQDADLVVGFLCRPNGIVPRSGHHFGSPSKFEDRVRYGALQTSGHGECSDRNHDKNQNEKEKILL